MARGKKWTLQFVSIKNTVYTVDIYEDNYSGAVTTLTGAPQPITTDEDGDKDPFRPVRTQSGYLRVFCDASTAYALIPNTNQSHYVELTTGGNVVWWGYMACENYTHAMYQGDDVYEFPLLSPVATLRGQKLIYEINAGYASNPTAITIGKLLKMCLDKCGVDYGSNAVYIGWRMSTAKVFSAYSVNFANWFEMDSDWDYDNTSFNEFMKPKMDCLEIIESVCRLFGYTLHEQGKNLIFRTADVDGAYYSTPYNQIANASPTWTPGIVSDIAMPASIDDQTTEEHEVGAKSITIRANINKHEQIISIPDWDEWKDGVQPALDSINNDRYRWRKDLSTATRKLFKNGVSVYSVQDPDLSPMIPQSYTGLRKVDVCDKNGYETNPESILKKRTFAFSNFITMGPTTNCRVSLRSIIPMLMKQGCRLRINYSATGDYNAVTSEGTIHGTFPNVSEAGNIFIGLSIYNGSAVTEYFWNYIATAASPRTNRWDYQGWVQDTHTLIPNREGTSPEHKTMNKVLTEDDCYMFNEDCDLLIETANMNGVMEVILQSAPTPQGISTAYWSWVISQLSISYIYPNTTNEDSENEYKRELNAIRDNEVTVNLDIASYNNNRHGLAFVISGNDFLSLEEHEAGTTHGGAEVTTDMRPEDFLLERMAAHYGKTARYITTTVDSAVNVAGYPNITDTGSEYAILAISRDYQNDENTIKLSKL